MQLNIDFCDGLNSQPMNFNNISNRIVLNLYLLSYYMVESIIDLDDMDNDKSDYNADFGQDNDKTFNNSR